MITLAPMTLRDLPLFNTVRNASREWLTDKSAYTLPEAADWFRRGGARQFRVVLLDGVPVGYCRVADVVHGDAATEKWVGMDIHPDYRGRGLAQPAYAELFAEFRGAGVRKFWLRVRKDNARARHIYDKLGFAPVAEVGDEVEMLLTTEEAPSAA